MDLGYGFELKTTKITGLIVIFGSIFLTILFYLLGKILFKMNSVTKKWMFMKISSAILVPLMIWFILNLVSIFDKDYIEGC